MLSRVSLKSRGDHPPYFMVRELTGIIPSKNINPDECVTQEVLYRVKST